LDLLILIKYFISSKKVLTNTRLVQKPVDFRLHLWFHDHSTIDVLEVF